MMPFEDSFSQYQKSDKVPLIIYADLECIIEETDRCKNNHEISATSKVRFHHISKENTPSLFQCLQCLLLKA